MCAAINLNYEFVCCALYDIKRCANRRTPTLNAFVSLFSSSEPRNHESRDLYPIPGVAAGLQSWRTRPQFDCFDYDWWGRWVASVIPLIAARVRAVDIYGWIESNFCHYLLMGSLVQLCGVLVRNPTHQFRSFLRPPPPVRAKQVHHDY